MTYNIGWFELLWGFKADTGNDDYVSTYYGLAIGGCFFGIVTATRRKDAHGVKR